MLNLSKNKLVFNELYTLLQDKSRLCITDSNSTSSQKHIKIVDEEIELMGFVSNEYSNQSILFSQLLKQFASQSEINIKTDKIQKQLLQQFLENDLKKMLEDCNTLKKILLSEKTLLSESKTLNGEKFEEYKVLLNQEKVQLENFKLIIDKNGELEQKFARAYGSAKYIDYNETIAKIKHSISKLMATRGAKFKIETPIGVENIPSLGPVIIAPRHYEAGVDGAALFSAIQRRVFILAGVDWIQTGTQNIASKFLYSGLGAIKINRQSRPDAKPITDSPYYKTSASTTSAIRQITFLLQSKEAIIVFPEGWANEGRTQGTIDKPNGVLPAQPGFMLAIELAQKESNQKISIIPTGLIVNPTEKTIRAVFGKPIYYEAMIIKNKNDIQTYREEFGKILMLEIKKLSNL